MARSESARNWAIGGLILAASLMIMLGIWQVLVGIAAIANDEFFVLTRGYTYDVDTTTWGWIHLILGVIVVLAGFALFSGSTWGRVLGIVLALLVAINNFLFLPYYPIWSIAVIALAVFVVWSLATVSRRDLTGDAATTYTADRSYPTDQSHPTDQPAYRANR